MDNYILRVFRREQSQEGSSLRLHGVVEAANSGQRRAFHSAAELWAILLGLEETDLSRHRDE